MRKILGCICLLITSSLGADPVCRRCEEIREENKGKVNPYEYYEDYLKDHPIKDKLPLFKDKAPLSEPVRTSTSNTPKE